jgi:hypothetical protein
MTVDHANMPGMGEQTQKTEQGKAAAPQKAPDSKKPDAAAPADKVKSQPKPGKS